MDALTSPSSGVGSSPSRRICKEGCGPPASGPWPVCVIGSKLRAQCCVNVLQYKHARAPSFARRLRLFTPSAEPPPGELPVEDEAADDDAGEENSAVATPGGQRRPSAWLVAIAATLPTPSTVVPPSSPGGTVATASVEFRYRNRRYPSAGRFQ